MKTLLALACLFLVTTLNAAVPDYKVFRGAGGITVTSNPPNGTIVIDGSGISAGALPTYAITNRQDVTTIFTNFALLKQNNHIQASSNVFVSGSNIVGSLRVTNDTYLGGSVIATNGEIVVGSSGFTFSFGDSSANGINVTNWGALHNKGALVLDDAGGQINLQNGAFGRVFTGSQFVFDSGSRLELDYLTANRVMITGSGSMATNHPDMRLAIAMTGISDGQVLKYDAASGTWTNATDATGSGTPAGNTTEVQYNNAGAFGANTNLLWDFSGVNPTLAIGKALYTAGQPYMELRHANGTNRLRYFGMTSMGSTATVGASNDAYRVIIAGDVSGGLGMQLTPGSEGGSLRNWNVVQGTNFNVSGAASVVGAVNTTSLVVTNEFYAAIPASSIVGGDRRNWQTNMSASQTMLLVASNLTTDAHYFVDVKSVGQVVAISNYQAMFFRGEGQGAVSQLSTNGTTTLEIWKDGVSGNTNVIIHGPELTLEAGPGVIFTTNSFTRVVTEHLNGVLTNLIGTVANNVTNVVSGWGIHNLTASGTLTTTLTNRSVGIATNAFNVIADFSDTANTQVYNVNEFSTNAVTIAITNGVSGRTVGVYLGTNMLTYTVKVLAMDGSPIFWNWNVTTNGATAFTKTNTVAARVFLTKETNGVYLAEMGYYRN
jgi:hypothetical protein